MKKEELCRGCMRFKSKEAFREVPNGAAALSKRCKICEEKIASSMKRGRGRKYSSKSYEKMGSFYAGL